MYNIHLSPFSYKFSMGWWLLHKTRQCLLPSENFVWVNKNMKCCSALSQQTVSPPHVVDGDIGFQAVFFRYAKQEWPIKQREDTTFKQHTLELTSAAADLMLSIFSFG